jgi:hypothetical protein
MRKVGLAAHPVYRLYLEIKMNRLKTWMAPGLNPGAIQDIFE